MKITVYVQGEYAKQTYSEESYDRRWWPGMELIRDALIRAGYEVGYSSFADVHESDVVLCSMTGGVDFYSFLAERLRWKGFKGKIVVGGAAVLNPRPMLPFFDVFVLGRGEKAIVDVIRSIEAGAVPEGEGIASSETFSMDRTYKLISTLSTGLYPHRVVLPRNSYQEAAVGCRFKCLFCNYTWTRPFIGETQRDAGAGNEIFGGGDHEHTLAELDFDHPEGWSPHMRNVAFDGCSQKIRTMINKNVSREMIREFLRLGPSEKRRRFKVYNVLGYPNETEADWMEMLEDLNAPEASVYQSPSGKPCVFELSLLGFYAMPQTPAAIWKQDYRGVLPEFVKFLRRQSWINPGNQSIHNPYCRDDRGGIVVVCSQYLERLSTHILQTIIWRGDHTHSNAIAKIALSAKFWGLTDRERTLALESLMDTRALFKEHTWDTVPTRNILPPDPYNSGKWRDVFMSLSQKGLVK